MKKAFVFDFDDTVAITDCKVYVIRNGIRIISLTPAEYNSYQIQENEEFDYSDFSEIINPKEKFVIHLMKEVHDENQDVYILTARSNIVADSIYKFLSEKNIYAKEIICVGDSDKSIEEEKRKVLMTIMEKYDKVYFYDDHIGNVEEAKKIGIKANLV